MSRNAQLLRSSALGLFGAVLLVCVGLIAGAASSVMDWLESSGDVHDMSVTAFENLADAFTEAGFTTPALDPDDPVLRSRKIVISGEINERSARRVVDRLLYLDAKDPETPIDLLITTSGGWPDSAFAIIDAIGEIRAPVNTIALGGCYSAGTMILVAGTGSRTATPNTVLSVHAIEGPDDGEFDYDRASRMRTEGLFRSRAALPASWFPMFEDQQYYLDPAQALELGIIDSIRTPASSSPATAATMDPG